MSIHRRLQRGLTLVTLIVATVFSIGSIANAVGFPSVNTRPGLSTPLGICREWSATINDRIARGLSLQLSEHQINLFATATKQRWREICAEAGVEVYEPGHEDARMPFSIQVATCEYAWRSIGYEVESIRAQGEQLGWKEAEIDAAVLVAKTRLEEDCPRERDR